MSVSSLSLLDAPKYRPGRNWRDELEEQVRLEQARELARAKAAAAATQATSSPTQQPDLTSMAWVPPGETQLTAAVRHYPDSVGAIILRQPDLVNQPNARNETPLWLAIYHNRIKTTHMLLAWNASLTPDVLAAARQGLGDSPEHLDMLRYLETVSHHNAKGWPLPDPPGSWIDKALNADEPTPLSVRLKARRETQKGVLPSHRKHSPGMAL